MRLRATAVGIWSVFGFVEDRAVMEFLRQTWWLLHRDLLLEWRGRERLTTMFFFVVVVLGVFGLALRVDSTVQRAILPGVLWATLALAGTLGMGQLYAAELEEDGIDGLRMAPLAREAIFVAKHLALFGFLLVSAVLVVPLAALMFQVDLGLLFPRVIPIFLAGLWGFSILGTLMATLLLQARFREALLPLLFLPVALPLVVVGARATAELLGQGAGVQTEFWLRGILLFDLLFLVVGLWLFGLQFER